jgi:hypothetical protein
MTLEHSVPDSTDVVLRVQTLSWHKRRRTGARHAHAHRRRMRGCCARTRACRRRGQIRARQGSHRPGTRRARRPRHMRSPRAACSGSRAVRARTGCVARTSAWLCVAGRETGTHNSYRASRYTNPGGTLAGASSLSHLFTSRTGAAPMSAVAAAHAASSASRLGGSVSRARPRPRQGRARKTC